MLERLTTSFAGRVVANATVPPVSESHRRWMQGLLEQSPANMQGVLLGKLACGDVTLEWQAVFQGAGVAYIYCKGSIAAVGMLLQGRFLSSEQAAIEAVQQTLLSGRGKSAGFDQIRRQHNRPLRAIVLLDEDADQDLIVCTQYWLDCLASVYFPTLPEVSEAVPASATGSEYPASIT